MSPSNEREHVSVNSTSSREVPSNKGTPETKASPFTPEGVLRQGFKPASQGISRPNKPSNVLLFPLNAAAADSTSLRLQDPFTSNQTLSGTTQVTTAASKLSPNASEFTPATLIDSGFGDGVSFNFKGPISSTSNHDGFHCKYCWVSHHILSIDLVLQQSQARTSRLPVPCQIHLHRGTAMHLFFMGQT